MRLHRGPKADGPRNGQGFGWHWEILQTWLSMSRVHGQARAEAVALWTFLHEHPEFVPTPEERACTPASVLIERIVDAKQRLERERERRRKVLETQQ